MYLVKALATASFPVQYDGPNIDWSANQLRTVDDNIVSRYREHSDVFTVVAGPDMGDVMAALLNDQSSDVAGAKNGSTVTVVETGGGVNVTTLTLTATPITIADDAGVAQYGGAGKVYDFPEGLIMVLGAVAAGSLTLGTTGTIINTFAGGVALGTAAAGTGATLVGTEANIMGENDVAAATSKVATINAQSTATAILDGTATAIDAYLNLVVDDDATHTAGTGTFTGTATIVWKKLGDN